MRHREVPWSKSSRPAGAARSAEELHQLAAGGEDRAMVEELRPAGSASSESSPALARPWSSRRRAGGGGGRDGARRRPWPGQRGGRLADRGGGGAGRCARGSRQTGAATSTRPGAVERGSDGDLDAPAPVGPSAPVARSEPRKRHWAIIQPPLTRIGGEFTKRRDARLRAGPGDAGAGFSGALGLTDPRRGALAVSRRGRDRLKPLAKRRGFPCAGGLGREPWSGVPGRPSWCRSPRSTWRSR